MDALLISGSHYRLPSGGWSGGGPFWCQHAKTQWGSGRNLTWEYFGSTWSGHALGVIGPASAPPTPPQPSNFTSHRIEADSHYATGVARTRPGAPVASLSQFLIELRDLPSTPLKQAWKSIGRSRVPIQQLPKLLRARLNEFRSLGSEYLNIEFGWKPFVSDLRKMYYLWQTIDRRMAQIIRNNGRLVRRKATLKEDRSTSQTVTQYGYPFANVFGAPPGWTSGSTRLTTTVQTYEKVWFSSAYQYWIPDVSSSQWNARARLALFGALPTPELLWEVLPWSWLVDWFSNVGDVVSNVSPNAVENCITRWAFVMRHTLQRTERKAEVAWSPNVYLPYVNVPGGAFNFSSVTETEDKVRSGSGNPFGLNVQLGSLTGRQLAILAALGVSRGSVR
jgi:hypothetical protein